MYEALTSYIPKFDKLKTRESYIKDATEGPRFGVGTRFENEVVGFQDTHPEFRSLKYKAILHKNYIEWNVESMKNADVSAFDGKTVMALLVAALRAEYWCTGAFEEFVLAGCIKRWLMRLKAIDEESA